jgi:hypothetical protein
MGYESGMAGWETVRRLAGELPEAEESTSYGTPAFKVQGRMFVRLKEDGETIVVRVDPDERGLLLNSAPDRFFITPHYQNWPYMLIRLDVVSDEELHEQLTDSWLAVAPKRLARSFSG